jgi:hypothetical protein
MTMGIFHILLLALLAPLSAWAASILDASGASSEATAESVERYRGTRGVVLLDVNWGRRWRCGSFENAELRRLSFDRLPLTKSSDDTVADLTLEEAPSLFTRSTFVNYAVIVEPGEYVLTGFDIKVARSVSDVAHWVAKRSELWKDGRALAGTFKVAPGETVYIGNFFLDCYQHPQPWRYYTEGAANFKAHLGQYKEKYPFLDTDAVAYRLFETTSLGRPYDLK